MAHQQHHLQQTHLLAAPLAARSMGERHDDKDQPLVAVGEAEEQLAGFDSQGLPANFVRRLIQDSQGGAEYSRIRTVTDIPTLEPNSGYCGYLCGSCCGPCFCQITRLIEEGELGLMRRDARYHFLAPGYHRYSSCGNSFEGEPVKISDVDVAVTSGPIGFVTISEAKIGVLLVGSNYKLLAPGTYQWSSPRVRLLLVTSVTERIVRLGPYTLVTVPIGEVAVTFNNGELVVLGHDDGSSPFVAAAAGASAPKRTYFLENAKWELHGFLPVVMQTDRLEGNDLLSKDNVEVLMVAMSQWRIVQPVRAVQNCAPRMEEIRVKVNQLVRATIARIVAGTCIGAGPVSGAASRPVVTAQPVMSASGDDEKKMPLPSRNGGGEPDLAHLMKSEMAEKHMAELTVLMDQMGIEVCGVYVPEKRMKNDDIRKEVAKQAVIGIKAEAERAAADAKAYATVKAARAEAEAIEVLARAHADAGERLGDPQTTASRLALSETLSKVMRDANLTVFSGAPESMPFMMTGAPAGGQQSRANRIEPRPHA